MRRSSIVAPLLLIGIGGLFLARNMYPELPLLDYLARYWPFLLILWGALRLAEVLFWAATDNALPARGVSGGEWILVVFLCLFGASLHTVRGFSTWWPRTGLAMGGLDMFGESFEYPIEGQKPASKTPRVVIETFRGNARITGMDGDTVKVSGHRTIRSMDQSGADRSNKDAPFELTGDANQVVIQNSQDRISGNMRMTADMEIVVPKGATIEAHGRYGDFDVTDVNGSVEITSDNAGVRLQNVGGDARIDLRNSDIVRAVGVKGAFDLKGRGADIDLQNIDGQVTVSGAYSGVIQFRSLAKPLRFNGQQTDLNIEKLPGQVRMALGDFTASNLVGPVHLSTKSRDVQISDFTNAVEIQVTRGDIDLRPGTLPLSRIDIQTRTGDITLSLPPAAKFDLTESTSRGDATNDFGPPVRGESDGRGASLRGSTGSGGPTLTAHTEHGQVIVRKASAEDKPLMPRGESPTAEKPLPEKPLKKVEQ
jgi:DUF4097 and DUF4098 domain-containing protein YvlB